MTAQLYFHSKLQASYKVNMIALLGNQPRTWTLPEVLKAFVDFRCEARNAGGAGARGGPMWHADLHCLLIRLWW